MCDKKKYLTPVLRCSMISKVLKDFAGKRFQKGSKMDKIYEQAMLFDFYGELLTEHQKSIYADAVYNDMSLGEIAEERGISRQGVHDLIKRCDRILQEYESKLHLVERFARAKETVKSIERLTDENRNHQESLKQIKKLAQELLEEL